MLEHLTKETFKEKIFNFEENKEKIEEEQRDLAEKAAEKTNF